MVVANGKTREAYLTKTTGSVCQTSLLGQAFTSSSPLVCFTTCLTLYPSNCRGFVFNKINQNCLPAVSVYSPVPSLPPSPMLGNDIVFFPNTFPDLNCNASLGFALYEVCGTSACLYLSTTKITFYAAVRFCAAKKGNVFVANSLEKFSLFWSVSLHVIRDDTYLGLTDSGSEGQFEWISGEPLSVEQTAYIWAPHQPDDKSGHEDCVEARHGSAAGARGLNDIRCQLKKRFICEQ